MPKITEKLRRNQLDKTLLSPVELKRLRPPKWGWIREIRQCLGMSMSDLAARLGVIKQRVSRMEKDEKLGKITLESLKKTAHAMDCELVYAFVPYSTLNETLLNQARKAAKHTMKRIHHTMNLEQQGFAPSTGDDAVEEITKELLRHKRLLWKVKVR